MYDEKVIRDLVARVRYAAGPTVVSVEEHFAGSWDELGITITLEPGVSDDQVEELRVRIHEVMYLRSLPFTWIVMFQRGGERLDPMIKELA
jgi:hypothetical protein